MCHPKTLWQELNQKGFFPGPEETEEEFKKRVFFCQNLSKKLEIIDHQLPFMFLPLQSQDFSRHSLQLSKNIYGIYPDWILVCFNNYQLSLWQGACTWIFQLSEGLPTTAFLQIRKIFQNQSTFLFLYHREELIVHECAHIARMLYQEPIFEEILAYRSSASSFRKFFGPLLNNANESYLLIVSLLLILFTNFFIIFNSSLTLSFLAPWLWIIPLSQLSLSSLRLLKRQKQLKKSLTKLERIFNNKKIAHHLLYRLTDGEIILFSQLCTQKIKEYMTNQTLISFRWKFLYENYPFII